MSYIGTQRIGELYTQHFIIIVICIYLCMYFNLDNILRRFLICTWRYHLHYLIFFYEILMLICTLLLSDNSYEDPHDVRHLLECPKNITDLELLPLWKDSIRAAQFVYLKCSLTMPTIDPKTTNSLMLQNLNGPSPHYNHSILISS